MNEKNNLFNIQHTKMPTLPDDIQVGDLLGLNEAGEVVKVSQPTIHPLIGVAAGNYGQKILVQLEAQIFGESLFISAKKCALCKKTLFFHSEEHPFFKDNLEYLEWEYAKR